MVRQAHHEREEAGSTRTGGEAGSTRTGRGGLNTNGGERRVHDEREKRWAHGRGGLNTNGIRQSHLDGKRRPLPIRDRCVNHQRV